MQVKGKKIKIVVGLLLILERSKLNIGSCYLFVINFCSFFVMHLHCGCTLYIVGLHSVMMSLSN